MRRYLLGIRDRTVPGDEQAEPGRKRAINRMRRVLATRCQDTDNAEFAAWIEFAQ